MDNLFIGAAYDYERFVNGQDGWVVVQACKEPYHRRALGYTTRGAPRDHPEYLIAHRGNRLILNLVDAPNPLYIPKEIIDAALEFVNEHIEENKVLVHCNQGESRSPSLGLLYLALFTDILPKDFYSAEELFRQIYPMYHPATGMRGYLISHWDHYMKNKDVKI